MPTTIQKKQARVRYSKCSPAIWKKFSLLEKLLWNDLYSAFLVVPELFAAGWDSPKDKKNREVTAHNMACQGVWTLKDSLLEAFKSKK